MSLLPLMERIYLTIGLVIAVLYSYQVLYLLIGLVRRRYRDHRTPSTLHRYAVLVSARNEEKVIGELLDSLHKQHYPPELLDLYVVADNCTDHTADVAAAAGATVYRRFDTVQVGKGYALDFLLKRIAADGFADRYAGYFVFDADNIIDPEFVYEMNRTFDRGGFDAVTSYRNSKNFGQNWITAGYSIWFLREARFVNAVRMALGTNCAVSGTGFLVSADVIRENGGWPYHLLTEDIQFSAECAASGRRIGYSEGAVLYDEQPATFRQSWDQRMRWSKGFYQVDWHYGLPLLRGIFRGGRQGWGCYDILLTVAPGILLTVAAVVLQLAVLFGCLFAPPLVAEKMMVMTGGYLLSGFLNFYLGMFLYGLITVLSEWKVIRTKAWKKLIYLVVFPFFILTYVPISVAALFQKKVEWKPIAHCSVAQLDQAA